MRILTSIPSGSVRRLFVAGALTAAAACGADEAPPPWTGTEPGATAGASTGQAPAASAGVGADVGGQVSQGTGDVGGVTPGTTGGASTGSSADATSGMTTGSVPTTGGAPDVTTGPGGEPGGGSDGGAPTGTTAGDVPPNSWRQMAFDVGSTYLNSLETVLTRDNAAQLEIAWRKDMGDNVYGAPLQIGDRIYASSGVAVKAFDAATGEELWRTTRTGGTGSMVYSEGVLFLHSNDSELVAIDAETGDIQFLVDAGPTQSDGSSSPILAGDLILIGGSNGSIELGRGSFRGWLCAHDRRDGSVVWTTYTVPEGAQGASIWSSVSADLEAGLVFAGTGNNYGSPATDTSDAFVAFDLSTGEIRWKNQRTEGDTFRATAPFAPDADFGANPVLYEVEIDGVPTKMLSAGQKSGDIHGVRRDDGMLLWSRSLGGGTSNGSRGVFVNSTWSGKHMLFAQNLGRSAELSGVDGAKGDILWTTTLPGQVYGRISVANGVGFVGAGSQMVIFDTDTGEVLKMVPSEGSATVAGTVTIVDGRVAYGEGMSWSGSTPGSTLTVLELP